MAFSMLSSHNHDDFAANLGYFPTYTQSLLHFMAVDEQEIGRKMSPYNNNKKKNIYGISNEDEA